MALEDFERELAENKASEKGRKRSRSPYPESHDRSAHKHSSRHERHKSKHRDRTESQRHHKRRRRSEHERRDSKDHRRGSRERDDEDGLMEKEAITAPPGEELLDQNIEDEKSSRLKRDSWMEAPSSLEIDRVQRKRPAPQPSQYVKGTQKEDRLRMYGNELNHRLEDNSAEHEEKLPKPAEHEVLYKFGDDGSAWRMTKLRGVYKQAEETERSLEEVALDQYGDLRQFDDAREEEIELDRRQRHGDEYVGKEKPNGDLYLERKLNHGMRERESADATSEDEFEAAQGEVIKEQPAPAKTAPLDQTALNRLKAQIMKAKLQGGPEAERLETEFNEAVAATANRKQADVVVLDKVESRAFTGGRKGEIKSIDNKRGRERGHVEENEDMSIEDMVRQERRTKGQLGDSGQAFAERIAKDAKFDDDLDYMDDNATKLAKSVQKSELSLRNTAIADYQKMKRILDNCPLCYHEDTSTPPQAPVLSLATRTFLTLPTSPEITPHGLCASIIPIQHRLNLLECDEDEWDEIRNFMKSLSRFYWAQKPPLSVIFYENAAHEGRKRHASMEAVPLPKKYAETAPAFFREAILSADEEWTQHRKLIDTGRKATEGSLGKAAFRKSMVSELPYFHVWFTLDGGVGHVVEDPRRWPKGDLFAREILGGMMDVSPHVIRKQGRWKRADPDMEERVKKFQNGWKKWDWTSVLMETQG